MESSNSDDPGPLPDGDRLLTQEEAAEVLRVSVRSVMTERYARRLGWVKVAGKIRIPMSAITAFLAAQFVTPAAPLEDARVASQARLMLLGKLAGAKDRPRMKTPQMGAPPLNVPARAPPRPRAIKNNVTPEEKAEAMARWRELEMKDQ